MSILFAEISAWLKAKPGNWIIAVAVVLGVILIFFGRQVRKLFGHRRIKHRRYVPLRSSRIRHRSERMRKPLPRSVGMHKASGRGYPKVGGGHIPFKRNKNGTIKNAKFVGGTVAAKNYMAKLRRNR